MLFSVYCTKKKRKPQCIFRVFFPPLQFQNEFVTMNGLNDKEGSIGKGEKACVFSMWRICILENK